MNSQTFSKSIFAGIATFLASMVTTPNVEAQEVDSESKTKGVLEEIIVTAQKREESVQDIPVTINAFNRKLLDEYGITNTRELATITPNLMWRGEPQTANLVFIRGVGSTAFDPTSVGAVSIYADEVYLNSQTVQSVPPLDLERIEILRGPQGTLYGRNTTGGIIRLISRKPRLDEEANARFDFTYGSYDTVNVQGAAGFPLGERAAARFALLSNNRDGIIDNQFDGGEASTIDSWVGRGQLLFEPNDDLRFLVNFHGGEGDSDNYRSLRIGLIDPVTGEPCANPGIGTGCTDGFGSPPDPIGKDFHTVNDNITDAPQKSNFHGGSVTIDWDLSNFTVTSISAYENSELRRLDAIETSPFNLLMQSLTTDAEQFSQELRLTSNVNTRFEWVVGLYYFTEDLVASNSLQIPGFGPFAFGPPPVRKGQMMVSDVETEDVAGFGQAAYHITEQLSVTGGVRLSYQEKKVEHTSFMYNWDAITGGNADATPLIGIPEAEANILFPFFTASLEDSWTEPSYRVSLDYKFSEDKMVFASFARGFKGGEFSGDRFEQDATVLVDPEFINAVELGMKANLFTDRLRVNASMFYYDYKDQQVFVFTPTLAGFPLRRLDNAAASTIMGLEVEFTAMPTPNWLIYLAPALLDTEFDEFKTDVAGSDLTGNKFASSPEVSFNGLIQYTHQIGPGTLSLQTNFAFRDHHYFSADNLPELAQGSYWLLNARVSYLWTVGDHEFEVAAWGNNILDEEYLVDGTDVTDFGYHTASAGLPAMGGVTFSYRFK